MEGHVDVPPQSAKDLWESEALGSSPSCSLSWSLARSPPSSHPNTKHCLVICVTLTEELGAVPPPSHSWMAPLMEDMLCDIRTGLTKAVVIGPGRAVLFYGRHSMGDGLTMLRKRQRGSDAFIVTGDSGIDAGRCARQTMVFPMHMCSGFPARRSKQMIMTS